MADYGVTPEGFTKMRLPEIREAIINAMMANLRARGKPDKIETRPDSVMGVVIDTFADREAAIWEMAEGVYYAMYPGSATGAALDRAVSFSGVQRLRAERSQAIEILYGTEGTLVPAGSQVRHKVTQTLWETLTDTTISSAAISDATVVPAVANSTDYDVIIDSVTYTYTSDANATLVEILAGMISALAASGLEVSSNGAAIRMRSTTATSVNISLSPSLTFAQMGSAVFVQTLEPAAESAAAGDLNVIVTLVNGWISATNPLPAAVGRLEETDADLTGRYSTGVFRFGAATLPSIAPNILNDVPGVIDVRVFHNPTDSTDGEGRLPHSVQVIVDGGVAETIAEAIYHYIAAGIDTNGEVVKTFQTPEGTQIIKFDRPESVYIWVKATISILPPEEQRFPSDGLDRVQAAIAGLGASLVIGQDVILQRFYCAIYAIPGISDVDLTFASSLSSGFNPSSGDYSAANITIDPAQKAKFDISRVAVT